MFTVQLKCVQNIIFVILLENFVQFYVQLNSGINQKSSIRLGLSSLIFIFSFTLLPIPKYFVLIY